jgi:hypothetical protein
MAIFEDGSERDVGHMRKQEILFGSIVYYSNSTIVGPNAHTEQAGPIVTRKRNVDTALNFQFFLLCVMFRNIS